METKDDVLSVDHKERLIKDGDELISYYLESTIKNEDAIPNHFVRDVDVYNKNPREVFDSRNPIFVFVKTRTETCGKTDGCESGCWRIMGNDKLIKSKSGKILGFKKLLKFCETKKPREYKRNWVMEEYRLLNKGKQEHQAVICKIQLLFELKISYLLGKHFSYLYTPSSYPRPPKKLFPGPTYEIDTPDLPDDASYIKKIIDDKGNNWSSSTNVYGMKPSTLMDLDRSYDRCVSIGYCFFVNRTKTCGKTDGCDRGCWRIMDRDRLIKSETGKVLGIKRIFKFCEKVIQRDRFEGEEDLMMTWTMEEYRLVDKKKQDKVICVMKLVFPITLNNLLRR